jgi:hypothetical protein
VAVTAGSVNAIGGGSLIDTDVLRVCSSYVGACLLRLRQVESGPSSHVHREGVAGSGRVEADSLFREHYCSRTVSSRTRRTDHPLAARASLVTVLAK